MVRRPDTADGGTLTTKTTQKRSVALSPSHASPSAVLSVHKAVRLSVCVVSYEMVTDEVVYRVVCREKSCSWEVHLRWSELSATVHALQSLYPRAFVQVPPLDPPMPLDGDLLETRAHSIQALLRAMVRAFSCSVLDLAGPAALIALFSGEQGTAVSSSASETKVAAGVADDEEEDIGPGWLREAEVLLRRTSSESSWTSSASSSTSSMDQAEDQAALMAAPGEQASLDELAPASVRPLVVLGKVDALDCNCAENSADATRMHQSEQFTASPTTDRATRSRAPLSTLMSDNGTMSANNDSAATRCAVMGEEHVEAEQELPGQNTAHASAPTRVRVPLLMLTALLVLPLLRPVLPLRPAALPTTAPLAVAVSKLAATSAPLISAPAGGFGKLVTLQVDMGRLRETAAAQARAQAAAEGDLEHLRRHLVAMRERAEAAASSAALEAERSLVAARHAFASLSVQASERLDEAASANRLAQEALRAPSADASMAKQRVWAAMMALLGSKAAWRTAWQAAWKSVWGAMRATIGKGPSETSAEMPGEGGHESRARREVLAAARAEAVAASIALKAAQRAASEAGRLLRGAQTAHRSNARACKQATKLMVAQGKRSVETVEWAAKQQERLQLHRIREASRRVLSAMDGRQSASKSLARLEATSAWRQCNSPPSLAEGVPTDH